jgi:large exoprotein involved in heme utilization and adhesion
VLLTDSAISASVAGGAGGSVVIDPMLVLIEDSAITANATQLGGSGGQIAITSDLFFARGASLLDASAPGGPLLSGRVEIHSPDVDLSGALTALPASFLDVSSLLHERCAARRSGARAGSFTVRGARGIAAEPDSPLATNGFAYPAHASAAGALEPVASTWPREGALLASRASCD